MTYTLEIYEKNVVYTIWRQTEKIQDMASNPIKTAREQEQGAVS